MGNGHSSLTTAASSSGTRKTDYDLPRKVNVPTLDFDNMPFLRPPDESTYSQANLASPSLSVDLPASPNSSSAEWNQGHAKQPIYHRINPPPSNEGFKASISHSVGRSDVSDHSFESSSSISSQLSILSQKYPSQASSSPRASRQSVHSPQLVDCGIDANVPPPVPPHLVIPVSLRSNDSFLETALAAVEALEYEAEEDLRVSRTRPRSHSASSRRRSLSRSLSRSTTNSSSNQGHSHSRSNSTASDRNSVYGTDIYTRKCTSPDIPDLSKSDTDGEYSAPQTPDQSFALDGYSEGHTRLRVVNSDQSNTSARYDPSEKYFVKSKAQLAEEEEQMQRRRYARYGQPFRGQLTR